MHALTQGFCRAYEHFWRVASEGEEDVFGFGNEEHPQALPLPVTAPIPDGHPAHLDRLTLRLTPDRYAQLARELSDVLTRAYAEGHSARGEACTLAVLAFTDPAQPTGPLSLSRHLNSFLGLNTAP